MMDKNAAFTMNVANVTGMKPDSFSVVTCDSPIAEVYNDDESRILDGLSSEYLALAELGDEVPCTFTDAQDFACMFEDLMAAKTVEDFEAIAGCYGSLAQRPGVRQFIEYHVSKLRSA